MSEMEMSIENEFVKSIRENYEALNDNEKFKEQFKDLTFKILLNPNDGEYAALIKVNKGIVTVEGIKNTPKDNLKKETLGWDSFMETTRQTFKNIGDGKLSSRGIRMKVLARKIKVNGLKHLSFFSKMANLTRESKK
ncbi:MAG: hypothetical protein ACFFD5_05085 [Candidatus Thorarchaeota archaeon]